MVPCWVKSIHRGHLLQYCDCMNRMSDIKLPECISESERLPGEEVALRNIVSLDDVESHIDEGESDELGIIYE